MANQLAINGAQPQKPTRYSQLYNGRWSSGLWTNRSPLRDAVTQRWQEKFYGAAGDALIDGTNVEITNRLTLARRPGNIAFDANTYSNVDAFYSFRMFGPSIERINVMIDQANALYSANSGVKSLVWTKSQGAGQTDMQSVGNTLYFGNGQDNKKWLQSLQVWTAGAQWGTASSPFMTTFLNDPNGNIQQLTGAAVIITNVTTSADAPLIASITCNQDISNVLSVGVSVKFPTGMNAAWLNDTTMTVTSVSTNSFTVAPPTIADFTTNIVSIRSTGTLRTATIADGSGFNVGDAVTIAGDSNSFFDGTFTLVGVFSAAIQWIMPGSITLTGVGGTATSAVAPFNYSGTENNKIASVVTGGTPISGNVTPTWSTTVPSSANNFQGGITYDGTVQWTNRGPAIQNWGLAAPTGTPTFSLGNVESGWATDTYYSFPGVIIDGNGNLQQVATPGISGTTPPNWSTIVGSSTTDGSVTWTMIETAADMAWTANHAYTTAKPFVKANAGGVDCLFELAPLAVPVIKQVAGTYVTAKFYTHNSSFAGQCELRNPADGSNNPGSGSYPLLATTLGNSTLFNVPTPGNPDPHVAPMEWATLNGAGNATAYPSAWSGAFQNYNMILTFTLTFPAAGVYTVNINHDDGIIWGMGPNATGGQPSTVSGINNCPAPQATKTPANGYNVLGANNVSYFAQDSWNINIPGAGDYPVEIAYCQWEEGAQIMCFYCQGQAPVPSPATSGANQPIWPSWSTSFASYNTTTQTLKFPNVTETVLNTGLTTQGGSGPGPLQWNNIGPTSDLTWHSNTSYTLPDTQIITAGGTIQAAYRSGVTGTTAPTFNTGTSQLTNDNPNLIWICEGSAPSSAPGTLSTFNGGWQYGIALVNTLDNTVSNCSTLTAATGDFSGATGVTIPPGSGIPDKTKIDPQADYVAIFRTTDGETVPFLIPGVGNTIYTLPLSTYLSQGYVDSTVDQELDNLLEGPISGENTPPPAGATNLTYHLNRIFFSVGNVVYWTSGPFAPVGNGVNGVSPLNFDSLPSLVVRIVPLSIGALVFTVSDVYLIQGQGTTTNPIQSAFPYLQGIGLSSHNALDINGSIIGFFSTDNNFLIFDPSAGVAFASAPIGDKIRLNNGNPGTSWSSSSVYVTWHVEGEDQAWYMSDGVNGWYRLCTTPAPETGQTWSPFATITGGCKAVQSIEISPGVHKLLIGPSTTGAVLQRDLTTFSDNGTAYDASAVLGSIVLAQPGQIAEVSFITTDSIVIGTPMTIGVLFNEALPYSTVPFDELVNFTDDPYGIPQSTSILGQRFYLNQAKESALCRHMQLQVNFGVQSVQNELLALTLFGAFLQEK